MDGAALVEQVRARLAAAGETPTPAALAAAVADRAGVHGDAEVLAALGRLREELTGAGALEPLLADPEVTDVLVNGAREVWVDRGSGLCRVPIAVGDASAVRRLAQRLAAQGGRRLDEAAPFVDVRLPGGVRLHAALPPVCPDGPCLSLRVPRRRPFRLAELLAAGSVDPTGAELLRLVVTGRLAFLVSGGAGAGKTTVLAALLGLVAPTDRVVLVEDCAELRPDLPHVVRLESRPPTAEGTGAVTLRELVRQSLRMRPDRLVLGEARGGEVVDLLTALNTGHEGGCATLHANRPDDLPARVEALGALAGLRPDAAHSLLAAAVDVVVHVARDATGRRRVTEVAVLNAGSDGRVRTAPAYRCGRPADAPALPGAARLAALLQARGVPAVALAGAGLPDDVGASC